MKKRFTAIMAAGLALVLSGCFKSRIVIDISRDAKATGSMTLMMAESMLTIDGTSIEESMEEMKAQYQEQYPDAEIETFREGEGQSGYAGIVIKAVPIEDIDIKKEGNKITVTVPLSSVQNEIADESGMQEQGTDLSALKAYGAEATLTVNMPAKATANFGTVSEKSVVVDLLSEKSGEPLVVTCSTGIAPGVVAVIICCAAVLIGLAAFYLSKKKKNI